MNILYILLWEGEMLHILLIGAAGELVACPVLLVVMLMNKLENRRQLTMIEGPFMPLDILIPIGVIAFFYLIRPLLKRVMQFLGNLRLPFRGLWWTLFIAYFLYEHLSAILYMNSLEGGASSFIVGEVALMTVLFIVLLIVFLFYNSTLQKQEEKMLSMQLRLIRQRAAVVQSGRAGADAMRTLITSQMERLQDETAAGRMPDADEIEDCLKQLEKIQMPEYRGRYCRDVLVDEMLSQIGENAEITGSRIDILVQQYDRGTVDEEDLVRLLYCLQETVKEPGDREELVLNASDSQFFIRMKADSFVFPRGVFAAIQRILRKYKGTIDVTNAGTRREAVIMLQKRSNHEMRKYA